MVTKNQKTGQVQRVELSRTQLGQGAVVQRAQGQESVLALSVSGLSGMSLLAVRPGRRLTRGEQSEARAIPPVRICLYEGSIEVNGSRVNIPIGLSGRLTAKEFKRFAGIDTGNALYVGRDGGMQRVRDKETIELVHDAKFTHRREQPVIRSNPRYSGS